jgi:hypothetical protein
MTLGNMRADGVRSIAVSCWQCHHEAVLSDLGDLRRSHALAHRGHVNRSGGRPLWTPAALAFAMPIKGGGYDWIK